MFGALFAAINVVWLLQIDAIIHIGVITKMSLVYTGVFAFLVLIGANLLLRRMAPRLAMSAAELLLVYGMMFMACSVAGLDFLQVLPSTLTHSYWYASPENHWQDLFLSDLPEHLTVSDPTVLSDFYEGGASLYDAAHVRPWLGPLAWWSALVAALVLMMTCANVLIRRRWVVDEKLSFPLTTMPVEMSVAPKALFSNRLMWAGFGAAFLIDLLGGLNHYWPSVPFLDIRSYHPKQYFTGMPWRAIGSLELGAPPFVVGLGYMLPLPVLFSCWFFFILTRLQVLLCAVVGLAQDRRMPYLPQQTFGAYAVIAVLSIVNARRYFSQVWRVILRRESELDDSSEPISYRAAAVGLAIGFALVMLFCLSAGMSPLYAFYFLVVYAATSLTLTRIRAELGPPAHDLPYASPGEILAGLAGARVMNRRDLAMSALMLPFTRGYRTHPMPAQLEALRTAEETGSSRRQAMLGTLVAAGIGVVATYWFILHQGYSIGIGTAKVRGEFRAFGDLAFRHLQSWRAAPDAGDIRSLWFVLAGAGFTVLMNWGKTTYAWWPLYPAGFALQGGWMMRHVWVGLFVAWLIKTTLTRYGSGNAYHRSRPFFIGLVLGEFSISAIWSLIGIVLQRSTWSFWS